jgi:hypothetical protein
MNSIPCSVSVRACAWVIIPRSPTTTTRSIPKRCVTARAASGKVCWSVMLPSWTQIATGRPSGLQVSP